MRASITGAVVGRATGQRGREVGGEPPNDGHGSRAGDGFPSV